MLRGHLMKAWRSTKRKPAALDTPPAPAGLEYLMDWFRQLSGRRAIGQGGVPHPITWEGIAAWAGLMGQRVKPWQVSVLCALDDLWRTAFFDGREKRSDQRDTGDRAPRRAPRRRTWAG